MKLLGMDPKTYRKTLTRLRAASSVVEGKLSAKAADRINYRAVPASAMLKYTKAFARKDAERFTHYLDRVDSGKEPIHAKTLFPYEIIRPLGIVGAYTLYGWENEGQASELPAAQLLALEQLWKALPSVDDTPNAISVIDTSGSMYWKMNPQAVTPALISQSLGLYHAERCSGIFHNHFISFESRPHLIEIKGNTLIDKIRYIQRAPWGGSTNLEAVFELILDAAVKAGASQQELPSVLYIISDMEFNVAVRDSQKTIFENAKELYSVMGYALPAVVFINVNSWQMQTAVRAHTKGAAMASGAGVSTFSHKFDGNITPMDHMLRVLCGERYRPIHA